MCALHPQQLACSQCAACCAPCRVLRAAYELRLRTPDPVRPASPDWDPLPASGGYTEFTEYPAAAVELFAQVRLSTTLKECVMAGLHVCMERKMVPLPGCLS